jgi:predicted nucleic acid-binding protein
MADLKVRQLDDRVVAQALRLALSLGHKVPDCLYLALAEREGASLATADARLARLAASRGVRVPHG